MNIPTLQALMIDLDGTMVDTMADFEAALNLALADIDLPKVDKSVVNIAVGKGSEHLVRTVLKHQLSLPEVQASGLVCDNTTVDTMYEAAFCVTSTTMAVSTVSTPRSTPVCCKVCKLFRPKACPWHV